MSDAPDYRATVFLPRTDFPMKAGLAEAEPRLLARWKAQGLYQARRAARAGCEPFIFHDGPPYANGDIHIGHALNKILKDLVVRTQALIGRDAQFIPGWDCHGLPIEWKIEEEFRKAKRSKDAVPPAEFRARCRAFAAHWVEVQKAQFERLGVLADWDNPYLTMDFEAEAAIVAELLTFARTGQLYRGAKPVMWSPVEQTALAEAEVEYEEVTSTQIDVAFEIVEAPNAPELVGAYAVVWTTTPWTIPVNQAIAWGPDIAYVAATIRPGGQAAADPAVLGRRLILAAELVEAIRQRTGLALEIGAEVTGTALAGAVARHPMHHLGGFFAKPRPFLPGGFVTTDQGTGLVHMAPDHGEDDFALCKAHGIDPVFAVEPDGRYRPDWAWLGGQGSVINPKFNAPDGPICADLKAAGALLSASADYRHSYPHSWRSKARLIYRATPQWFIAIDRPLPGDGQTLRQRALAAIEATRFIPERGRNRIRAMVEARPDWLISRQRAWGVPITLFVNRQSGDYLRDPEVDGRIIEAVRAGGADAWFDADAQALLGPRYCAEEWERVTDILDVWFDSGSTHAFVLGPRHGVAQADLYLEGSDQHRGWFQSSLLEAVGTRGHAPYKAVMTHGFTLDGEGRKMSKSLGNVVDPLKVIETSGADILRLWVASSGYFDDVRIGREVLAGTAEQYRKLRNTLRYLLGALDGWDEAERLEPAAMPELERWVLHRLAELSQRLKVACEAFDFTDYITALSTFANSDLSAFWFDVRKDSLYCDAPASTTRRAVRTVMDLLFHALVRWLAPVLPFTAEEAWGARFPEAGSVHLLDWPGIEPAWMDAALGQRMERLRALRGLVTEAIEPLRRSKAIGASTAAHVTLAVGAADAALLAATDFAELAIVAEVAILTADGAAAPQATARPTALERCARCWRHLPEVGTLADPNLCRRCHDVVHPGGATTPSDVARARPTAPAPAAA